MFFDKGFTHFYFCRVERIDFGNFGGEVWMKFNGVVIRAVRRELVMGFLQEDICEVFAPFRYDRVHQLSGLGNLGGNGGFVDLFSIQPGLSFI